MPWCSAATGRSCGPRSKWPIASCPAIGVNLGRLGFLADLTPDEFVESLPAIVAGKFSVVEHLMFECSLIRNGQVIDKQLGLNEVGRARRPAVRDRRYLSLR